MVDKKLIQAIKDQDYNLDSYYIFDYPNFLKEVNFFKETFKEVNPIFSYSYKTNYLKPLIKSVDKLDFLSEVVSPFEVEISKIFGIDPSKLIYNGPLKDEESIKYVLSNGGIVNADHLDELKMIFSICSSLKSLSDLRIGVRLSFESINLGSRFGIQVTEENVYKILNLFSHYSINQISSLHIHFPERDINNFKARVNAVFSLAKLLIDKKFRIGTIDIGGGFPSMMSKSMLNSLQISKNQNLSEYFHIIKDFKKKYQIEQIPIIFEPGTAIASNALHLVGHIRSINTKKEKVFLNTDISRTLLGGLKNEVEYPIEIIKMAHSQDYKEVGEKKMVLSGFSCVESDTIKIDSEKFTNSDISDKFVLSSIGSYSSVFKSPFIRGDVALFEWDGEELRICRRAQNASDINNLYI